METLFLFASDQFHWFSSDERQVLLFTRPYHQNQKAFWPPRGGLSCGQKIEFKLFHSFEAWDFPISVNVRFF